MRYALVSDIHANLQAWKAVLLDSRSINVDAIVCLGDIVGYGPNPGEVLQSVYESVDHFCLGNHDAVLCGKLDGALFNDAALASITWTRKHLSADAVKFLSGIPLTLKGEGFRCTHGEFCNPSAFNYIIDPGDAMASWQRVEEQLLFVGHSHVPGVFVLGPSRQPHKLPPQDFELEPTKRYLVNIGSVGSPRDGDTRASYAIYDDVTGAVSFRRVPFDLDAYREALGAVGLSEDTSRFLRHDPLSDLPALRERLHFSPAMSPDETARDTVEVKELEKLKSRLSRWKGLALLLLLASFTGAALGGSAWWRATHRSRTIRDRLSVPVNALVKPVDHNLLDVPRPPVAPGNVISGWHVHLADKHTQAIAVDEQGGNAVFVLTSTSQAEAMRLFSPPIQVAPGTKMTLSAQFKKATNFTGHVAAVISVTRDVDGRHDLIDQYEVKEPTIRRKDGWMEARRTFELPAHTRQIEFQLRGRFAGEVRVRDMSLVRR